MSCSTCSIRPLELFLRGLIGIEVASHHGAFLPKHFRRPNPRYFHARASPILRRAHAHLGHAPSACVSPVDASQPALEAAHDPSSSYAEPTRSIPGQSYPKELQHEAVGSEAPERHESSPARDSTTDRAQHALADTVNARGGEPAFLELNPENIYALARRATEATQATGNQVHTTQKAKPKRAGSTPSTSTSSEKLTSDISAEKKVKKEGWQIQKEALSEKFGDEGWAPRKRLSPDALEGIRALHAQYPDKFTTPVLAEQFKVSSEAIRRILKSKWRPSEEEEEDRRKRWDKRGEQIWTKLVELGTKPPKKWREMGVGKAEPGQLPKWKRRRRDNEVADHDEDIPWDTNPQAEREGSDEESLADRIL